MFAAILTLHIIVSITLVLIVLLQSGRGAELGAAFGGMGQSTYGRGQFTFVSKLTTAMAVIFMVTSLTLALMTTERTTGSVVQPSNAVEGSAVVPTAENKDAAEAAAPSKPIDQQQAPAKASANQ